MNEKSLAEEIHSTFRCYVKNEAGENISDASVGEIEAIITKHLPSGDVGMLKLIAESLPCNCGHYGHFSYCARGKALALAALASVPANPPQDVCELALCEINRLFLHAGRLYRFVQMDGCKDCEQYAKQEPANPPQVDTTLDEIADGVQAGAVEFAELGRPMSSDNMRKLSEAISAHARKSQGVNERLLNAAKRAARILPPHCGNPDRASFELDEAISVAESAAVPSMEVMQDKERLDWLEKHEACINKLSISQADHRLYWHLYHCPEGKLNCEHFGEFPNTLRQVIDDARKEGGK